MVLAARSAPDGEVIQFLAGAPELLARYRNAPPAAAALITPRWTPAAWAWERACRRPSWKPPRRGT